MLRDRFSADQWDEIEGAAARYEIDSDFLASIILAESSGRWDGGRVVDTGTSRFLPYVGLSQQELWAERVYIEDIAKDRSAQVRHLAKRVKDAIDGVDYWRVVAERYYRWTPVSGIGIPAVWLWMKTLKEERDALGRD